MKDLTFSGNLPFKIEGSLNLQDGFRHLTGQMLQVMFQLLKNERPKEYPYSTYSAQVSEGRIEKGIQLVIEADCFGTDFLMLRMHSEGYTLVMTSEDDNIGSFEYQFIDDDDLVESIPQQVRTHMEKHRYGFDLDETD